VRRSFLGPFGLALAVLACLAPRAARADEPPVTVSHGLSAYEEETLAIAEHDHHLVPDPSPEGKIVEEVQYARFDVIDKRDVLPEWVDIFHATTTTAVLGREVLQPVGAPFHQYLADETERNLRTYAQLSVVLLRAERGSRPDRVKLLLVTKDVWSLRLNWDLGFGQGGLQFLNLQTTEINLAGTLQSVSATFNELPKSVLYGVSYSAPRLDAHWLRFGADASVIVNRDTGSAEGTAGSAHIARPLFSTHTEWSWGVGSSWVVDVARRYINTDVAQYQPNASGTGPTVPWEWNERNFTETVAGTRSFGVRNKDDVTFGFEMNVRDYSYPTGTRDVAGAAPSNAAIDQFLRAEAPVSDTRVGPFLQWHHYKTDFLRLYDVDSLSLQEDFRLGLDTYLRVYPVTEALGSTRNFVGSYAAAQDTWSVGDGLFRVLVENTTEAQSAEVSDGRVDADLHFVSPKTAAGRLVVDGYGLDRYRNYLNLTSVIGGDTRLRGYPSGAFLGRSLLAGNVEWRTRGLDVFKVLFAGVAFYDAGDAFDSWNDIQMKQSVGVGVRAVFPQLERLAARLDLGFPLVDRNLPGVAPAAVYLTFGQALGVGQVSPPGGIATDGTIGAVNQVGVLGY
jgi:hypothetical protein